MEVLSLISKLCENYRGHEQLLGFIGYNCMMFSGLCKEESINQKKLQLLGSKIYDCRTILRFLDDFSMLNYSISYGLGKQVSFYFFTININFCIYFETREFEINKGFLLIT